MMERAGLGLLHRLDPERAHGLSLLALRMGLVPLPGPVALPRLATTLAGMALMKKDMGGAACTLALARLVMEARLPVRLRVLDAGSACELMLAAPSVIKRPVVEWPDGSISVGFDTSAWSARL